MIKIIILFVSICFCGCSTPAKDSIRHKEIFTEESIKFDWNLKPKSIVEAVWYLDSMASPEMKCEIFNSELDSIYFDIGLQIRNEWIRKGNVALNNEMFNTIKLGSIDYSSGLILLIYKSYLSPTKNNFVTQIEKNNSATLSPNLKIHLLKIQSELDRKLQNSNKISCM